LPKKREEIELGSVCALGKTKNVALVLNILFINKEGYTLR